MTLGSLLLFGLWLFEVDFGGLIVVIIIVLVIFVVAGHITTQLAGEVLDGITVDVVRD